MKNKLILLYYSLTSLTLIGQIDLDNYGNYLDPVEIGQQTWMATNLNTDKFTNGDLIPEAKSEKAWIEACTKKQPAWCYFENKSKNGKIYGKLYNWYAVNDPRGLAPKGWRIPTAEDVENLVKIQYTTLDYDKDISYVFKGKYIACRLENAHFSNDFDQWWWTSKEISDNKSCAFSSGGSCKDVDEYKSPHCSKAIGFPVRCILEKK